MCNKKIQAVRNWPAPNEPSARTHLQQFMGLANIYRRFIRRFSHIAAPLTDQLITTQPFKRSAACQHAFNATKKALTSAPVLVPLNSCKDFTIFTDASETEMAIVAASMQDHGQGLQAVACLSRKLNPAEQNYAVHEKAFLAVIYVLQQWRHYVKSAPTTVFTDHQPLQHF